MVLTPGSLNSVLSRLIEGHPSEWQWEANSWKKKTKKTIPSTHTNHRRLPLTGESLPFFRGTPLNWASFSSVAWLGNLFWRDSQFSSPVYLRNALAIIFFLFMLSAACRISLSESCRWTTFRSKSSLLSFSRPWSGMPIFECKNKRDSSNKKNLYNYL